MQAVPVPSYTRYDGFGNLVAHYGVPPGEFKSLRPDIGTMDTDYPLLLCSPS